MTTEAFPEGQRRRSGTRREPLHADERRLSSEEIARAVSRHWKIALLVAASLTLLAWLAAAMQPKRYRVSAIASVAPRIEQLSASEVFHGVDTLERRVVVATVAALAATPATARQVQAGPGDKINAIVLPTTNLFQIDVEGGDPKRITAIANETPAVLSRQAAAMYKFYDVRLLSPASVPHEAALPRVQRAVIAGLVLGLLLGITVAYLIDWRVRREA